MAMAIIRPPVATDRVREVLLATAEVSQTAVAGEVTGDAVP